MKPFCGYRNKEGAGYYLKAKEGTAQFAEFQWMASIEVGSNKICTGSLLDKKVVMTTASCVEGKNLDDLKVRLGSWKAQSKSEKPNTEEIHKIKKVVTSTKVGPNLALLILEEPAQLNTYINSVCLLNNQEYEDDKCIVVGWGDEKSSMGDLKVKRVIDQSCTESDGSDLPKNSKCIATTEKFETGAALLCQFDDTDNYMQVGIALSNTNNVNSATKVFAKIDNYKEWIDETLNENDIGNEAYTYSLKNLVKYSSGEYPYPPYTGYIWALRRSIDKSNENN